MLRSRIAVLSLAVLGLAMAVLSRQPVAVVVPLEIDGVCCYNFK